jgi:exoribonuclease R
MTEKYKVIYNEEKHTYSYTLLPDYKDATLPFEPHEKGLFFNDVFSLSPDYKVEIVHSSIKFSTDIPGVLIINGNKTYGRAKNGKLLYKCIPDDKRLQPFLIPYDIKHVDFSKVFVNLYVTFAFSSWEAKHPFGVLTHVIGAVNELDNFYEYQLYCKSLNNSIQKFQKDTAKALHVFKNTDNNNIDNNNTDNTDNKILEIIKTKFPKIEDRISEKVYTIDPKGSVDLDDGFSICEMTNSVCKLSIYIANVTIWIDVLNLWDSFSRRISTIYLPDKKRPMLPTILSDSLCSLLEKQTRVAFVMDIYIQNDDIIDIQFLNCFVRVKKNFVYDEPSLLSNESYQMVLKYSNILLNKYKYINSIKDSHDLVAYLMILMNYNCAKELLKHGNGIFRSSVFMKKDNNTVSSIDNGMPERVSNFIRCWKSSYGQYINLENNFDANIRHETLNIDAYIHITSPIRRLVDLLNIIRFQQNNNMTQLSASALAFYDKWLNELEYINTTMRSIRKVQTDCDLLTLCSLKPGILETEYDGYLFDNISRNDGLYQFIVYLPDLNLTSRINLNTNIPNYTCRKFKIYIFEDEDRLKKKIRLHLLG